MYLQLVRESFTETSTETSTEGKLFINGEFECHTLEDTDRKLEDGGIKINKLTAIPRGKYPLVISMSNRFKKPLIEVLDVPGFTGIRIHTGNSSIDTEGCILVGSSNNKKDDDWIGGSRIAYKKLHSKVEEALSRNEEITLEIV